MVERWISCDNNNQFLHFLFCRKVLMKLRGGSSSCVTKELRKRKSGHCSIYLLATGGAAFTFFVFSPSPLSTCKAWQETRRCSDPQWVASKCWSVCSFFSYRLIGAPRTPFHQHFSWARWWPLSGLYACESIPCGQSVSLDHTVCRFLTFKVFVYWQRPIGQPQLRSFFV